MIINRRVLPIIAVFVLIVVLITTGAIMQYGRKTTYLDELFIAPQVTSNNDTMPFTFTAVGDFGKTDDTASVLKKIADTNSDFTLALGDLGYGGNGTENDWCSFVTSNIGSDHPFQIIAGNHDDGTNDGDITAYAKCLPDKIGGITGTYGIEYFFDYNELARFILISPDINNYGFNYDNGSENLQWVIDSVNDARSKGINWIVLGMHKNCLTPGLKTCEIGEDLLNTAVALKVDLVLQGHDHAYFRSKQLALSTESCPAILINSFDQFCIKQSGNDLKKGAGTVIVINGTGGYGLRDVNTNDPEFNYFQTNNASNTGNTFGLSEFEVNSSSLNTRFIPAVGDYVDDFSIR